ncbi:DUF916 and DUF3324 domain-containing protein [Lactobacillus sp. YT155]|uniref:DUF916 and DUF3324 domain-containing protein n=1 Tax=Lactobacillus sp. YT155 TaxID=3060955 RepID=UPI00265F8C7D|nr:DUF916 and DUF3324 domain-containing protein [Lactobacillus sp. YT155]MDO1604482.1 DUF916 and DUF3324 domain-containing protein [Lactobacillus sp. YT155]
MKNRILKLVFVLGSIFLFTGIFNHFQEVQAADAGFTINAKLPDNQYDDSVTYFDLLMKPGQNQKLVLTVENLTGMSKTIKVSPNSAYTANGASEAYDKYNQNKNGHQIYSFKNIVSQPQTVKLKAHETKDISFEVRMPTTKYQGILEGAFYATDVSDKKSNQSNNNGFSIKNRYSMAVGLILREHENQHVQPDFKLRQIRPSASNYTLNSAILTEIENNKNATIGNLSITTTITPAGSSKVLLEKSENNRSVAPNSSFLYGIGLGNKWLNPGKYHLKMIATNGVQRWVINKDFTIDFMTAMKLNQHNNSLRWLWILLAVIIIVLLVLILIIWKKRRKKSELTS